MYPSVLVDGDVCEKNRDYGTLRRNLDQLRRVAPNFLGDYYPLRPYGRANDSWIAWQYDRPEVGEGVVQAFRRPACPEDSLRLCLRGLDSEATYEVKDADKEEVVFMSGKQLTNGLAVTLPGRPAAALIIYKKK
jgi:alpha-galactosidase